MQSDPMEANRHIFEAIALKKCIEATYNRMALKLAPHILYTRHGDLFIDAVTVERDGKPPKEIKLGTFKLSGLTVGGIVARAFTPDASFNPADPKYDGVTLFVVER